MRIYDVSGSSPMVVNYKDKLFEEKGFLFADSTFFDIFSFKVLRGNPNTLLDDLNTVVLTESAAKKYFGEEDPLDKSITTNGTTEYRVTGVVADAPANSQIKFDFIASFHTLEGWREEIWNSANFTTYLQLNSPNAAPELEKRSEPIWVRLWVKICLQIVFDVCATADARCTSAPHVEGGLEHGSDIRYV
ncbi:MAG: ABC transporter permease [Saprospiraceae bacterium]|nr:ABC transporter permease [Saprospiraceae bacterium]